MFSDFTVEQCATLGTGTYSLGGPQGEYYSFGEKHSSGARIFYVAKTVAGSPTQKWEYGRGVLTTSGDPDTLTRATILGSSNAGAAIDWQASDIYWIYSAPLLDVLGQVPLDWIDTAAVGRTISAIDKGAVIECDVTSANRTVTMPTGASLDDEFFSFGVYGYGSTSNSVVLTPAGTDYINEQAVGTTKSIAGGTLTYVYWDPVKLKWRTK